MKYKGLDEIIKKLDLAVLDYSNTLKLLDSEMNNVITIDSGSDWVFQTDFLGFQKLSKENQKELLKATWSYVEYQKGLLKSIEDVIVKPRYHVWYIDFEHTKRYFIKVQDHKTNLPRLIITKLDVANLSHDDEYSGFYELTADDIYLLPKEWLPYSFGGLGLTKIKEVL